jgi:hypothetical protein
MNATWRSLGAYRRERDWSIPRLLHELQKGLPYRTIPEGFVIEWGDAYLRRYLNVEASEISVPYGTECGAIVPPAPKKGLAARGVTLGIEVLPPGAPTDAEMPAPSANAPAASPAPSRKVSEADVRDALLAIVAEHPPGSPPPDEEALHTELERRLDAEVQRDRVRQARDDYAPQFKRPVGRPRKGAQ